MLRALLIAFTLLVLNVSCSRGGSGAADDGPHVVNPNDTTPPVLEINTPTEGQVFANGSTVNVTGKITDDNGLYQGKIRIVNDVTGAVIREQPYEIHYLLSYNFNISQAVSVTTATDFTVTVSFEDHGQNVVSKSVKIKVNP